MPLRNLIIITLAIIVSMVCFAAAAKNRYANIVAQALMIIEKEALQEIPAAELFDSAMNGMMKKLDKYSAFIAGEEHKIFNEDLKQEFGGVGMYLETNPETKRLFVLAPMPDTPAFDADLRIGDEILKIDGQDVVGIDRSDAVKLLRGPINQPVILTIQRDGETLEKSLRRASIPIPSVTGDYRNPDRKWQFVLQENPRIGYIRLHQFGEKTGDEFEAAFREIDGSIDGLILDLRHNSGGLLEVAVRICDLFLEKGLTIVSTRGRHGKMIQRKVSEINNLVSTSLPVVILVNRYSASASEIVAGCLQDHQRAVIIGEQSWGKGTVQNVIPMQRGESALKLTTASYWRPSGIQIDRNAANSIKTKVWGVQPDTGFEIELTKEELFKNLRYRNIRDLEGLVAGGHEQALAALKRMRQEEIILSDEVESDDQSPLENSSPEDNVSAENSAEKSTKNESLLPPKSNDSSTNDSSTNDSSTNDSPQPDDDDPPAKPFNEDAPHIDQPVRRALEYFETVLDKQSVAAQQEQRISLQPRFRLSKDGIQHRLRQSTCERVLLAGMITAD